MNTDKTPKEYITIRSTPIERCHRCLLSQEAYCYGRAERYGRIITDFYCKSCAEAILSNPELKSRQILVKIASTVERIAIPRITPQAVEPKKPAEKDVFLTRKDIEMFRVTPSQMVMAELNSLFTNRSVINRKIYRLWGGKLPPNLFTETLKLLEHEGKIECLWTSSRDTLVRRLSVEPSKPEPMRPELVQANGSRHLSSRRLKENGLTVDAIVLDWLTEIPKTKTDINGDITKEYGGRLSDSLMKRVLRTLMGIGCAERIAHTTGKEEFASYRLARKAIESTQSLEDQNVQNNPSRSQPFANHSPKGQ